MYLAVCDDELAQLELITRLLDNYPQKPLLSLHWKTFQSGYALLSALEEGEMFDAILLDIYMLNANGMDIAKSIRRFNEYIPILFLTSSPDYAVESYRVNAADYLLKPLTAEKLFPPLDKLFHQLNTVAKQGIVVKNTTDGMTRILFNNLLYLEAEGHASLLHCADKQIIRTATSFSKLCKQLFAYPEFIQIHRSYLVNLQHVHRVTKKEVFLLDGTALPLARSHQLAVSEAFLNYSFNF